jgi:hypothetical protein
VKEKYGLGTLLKSYLTELFCFVVRYNTFDVRIILERSGRVLFKLIQVDYVERIMKTEENLCYENLIKSQDKIEMSQNKISVYNIAQLAARG